MQDDGSPQPADEVVAVLTDFADRLRAELVGVATVKGIAFPDNNGIGWDLQPMNPRCSPVSWILFGDDILLQAGKLYRGGRWELDRSVEDFNFVERVVRAAIAGRITETSALARSRVEVTLEDGHVVHETGYEGCLALVPLPGWRRWGRGAHYEPYALPSR
jgi:hypothetical protein